MGSLLHRENLSAFVQGVCGNVIKGNRSNLLQTHITHYLTNSVVIQILLELSKDARSFGFEFKVFKLK